MANLFLQRETKLFIELTDGAASPAATGVFEIPMLEGFSFSQATNMNEVSVSEASPDGKTSRRGTAKFTDSLAPAEFSFSTYMRPFKSVGTNINGNANRNGGTKMHSVEEALWALFAGAKAYRATAGGEAGTDPLHYGESGTTLAVSSPVISASTTASTVAFSHSDRLQMAAVDFYFVLGSGAIYKLKGAVLNEVSIDFDIDGIATCSWSGFANAIIDDAGTPSWMASTGAVAASALKITEGITATNNFIQNRLSTVALTQNAADDPNANTEDSYTLTLTGGSITLSNNIQYVTPSVMGVVNQPLAHYNGAFNVTGSLSCYLDTTAARSSDLFEDLAESSTFDVNNFFNLNIVLGGAATTTTSPTVQFLIPAAHLEIPSHSIDEVIGMDINFHAMPHSGTSGSLVQDIEGKNDLTIIYKGLTPDGNLYV